MMTSRQIKRMEAVTRSPVYSSIPSTLEGLSVIRAFGAEKRFLNEFHHNQNENTRVFFAFLTAGRWLGLRLDMLSALLITCIAFACIALRSQFNISSGSLGLLLTYMMQLTGLLQWCVRQSSELENLMVSTERVFEYANLPSEAPSITDVQIPKDWPFSGECVIKDMSLSYPNLQNPDIKSDPVLKNITIKFEAGSKIGIVGRTGAGKSSFLQALFRLVEPEPPNSIVIDGVPTSGLGLSDLRSRLSIIPQEPFCFKGTIRFNLDPFNRYTDEELWKVLDAVELKSTLQAMANKLESEVSENGGK